jgi:cell division protein FtsI (penicillin-binding protein 3)
VDQGPRRRAAVLGVVFFCVFLALLARLYAVQVLGVDARSEQRLRQQTGEVAVSGIRGTFLDPRGQVVAVSVPADSVFANPAALPACDRADAARQLAAALGLSEAFVLERLSRSTKEFVWLKRKVSDAESKAARALAETPMFKANRTNPVARLGFRTEFRRVYPQGSLMSQLVGHQSEDPSASEGLERWLDPVIAARELRVPVVKDGKQRVLDAPSIDAAGPSVTLTVDVLFQKIVEEELDAACREFSPKWAVAIALDPASGAVLAIANRPAFDPNDASRVAPEARLNRAVALPYEPGSTLKPFTAAWAIELGLASPDTKIDCENGVWKYGPRILHDHDPYGRLTLAEIIIKSSNIGAAKIGALILGAKRTREALERFGFGSLSGIDLPAEDDGRLFPLSKWNLYSETSVPMGHEVMVTPLQLVAGLSAIANGGTLFRPYVVKRVETADGVVLADNGPTMVRRVISKETARKMDEILRGTVKDGTGKKAQVPGVEVGGKTGTSQKIDPVTKKYTHEKYISSFVGYAPAGDPKVCIAVIVDEPQGAYYGGAVAAPVVGRILQRGLVLLR